MEGFLSLIIGALIIIIIPLYRENKEKDKEIKYLKRRNKYFRKELNKTRPDEDWV